MEDNATWSYIVSTVIIRFIGVFVVLGLLQIGIYVSGRLVSRFTAKAPRVRP